MAQRFTVDRQSFEQFLAAAALLQQFRPQSYRSPEDRPQPLMELLALERAIEQNRLDLSGVMKRVVRLAESVICASAVGLWLFTEHDFAYCTGAGHISNDERLRLEVLSKLKAYWAAGKDFSWGESLRQRAYGAPYCPGCMQSTIVSPIFSQDKVAGVLAAFSTELDAFSRCDLGNMVLLASVLGQALSKAAETGLNAGVGMERSAMPKLIDQIVASLETMINEQAAPVQPLDHSLVADNGRAFEWANLADFGSEQWTDSSSHPSIQPSIQDTDIVAPTEAPCDPASHETPPRGMTAEDISIPGIGVRAALGSDLEEFLPPGPTLRERLAATTASLGQIWSRGFQRFRQSELAWQSRGTALLRRALSSIRYRMVSFPIAQAKQLRAITKGFLGRTRQAFAEQIQRTTNYRSHLANLSRPELSSSFRAARSFPSQLANDAGNQLRSAIGFLNAHLGRAIAQRQSKFRSLMHKLVPWANRFLKGLADYIPDLPALPKLQLHGRRWPTQPPPPITGESTDTSATRYEGEQLPYSYRARKVDSLAHLDLPTPQQLSTFRPPMHKGISAISNILRGLSAYIPDLPALPKFQLQWRRRPSPAPPPIRPENTYAAATRCQLDQLQVCYRPNVRQLRRAASPLGILLVMAAFLILEIALHNSEQVASASSRASKVSAQPVLAVIGPATVPSRVASAVEKVEKSLSSLPGPSSTVNQVPRSHLQVTDLDTKTTLEDMTAYEIATLRRAAEYGDDSSAFQLGMAYEIGYQLHQDCAKAAQWVLRAAKEGNIAAQYNLGLRYRDGDGLSMDLGQAEKWLRRAAEANYSAAKIALANLKIQ